jgi:long-chain acyl-CoA synthetase
MRGLDALGLKRGDAIAILAENCPRWAVTDIAAQGLGLVMVAPYATLPASQAGFIVADSGAKIVVVSDGKQLAKVREFRTETPDLQHIITLDASLKGDGVLTFDEVSHMSGKTDTELDALIQAVKPHDTATYLYTSGTTGNPKGAVLTHNNLLHTPDAVIESRLADLNEYDVFLSFLPLSHITERLGGHYLPMRVGGCIVYSLGLSALADEIQNTVRPTFMLCVPRLWENMYAKALEGLAKRPEKDRKKIEWAITVGKEVVQVRSAGGAPGLILKLKHALAEKLILSKVRAKLTGGRLRYAVSGGAPLEHETALFFLAVGVQLLEGYGLSETNIIAINRPEKQRVGTVGTLLPHVEVRIAEDGEILMRGQGKMQGYHHRPQETAEAIDAEGWFHTGDIGELSQDGYLKITDRKKDLLVLSNGKKVAPQPIEGHLKQSPYIGEAVLFGDRKPTVSVLLVPAFDRLLAWAKEQGLKGSAEEIMAHEAVQRLFKEQIDAVNATLPDYERIKRFRLAPRPFSIEGGELTPTLKVKRRVVAEKYAELLADF